jgi:hypothetical protein
LRLSFFIAEEAHALGEKSTILPGAGVPGHAA